MTVRGVRAVRGANASMLALHCVEDPHHVLEIAIGGGEALAIAAALNGLTTPRPLTHDLLVSTIGALGGSLVEVVVTHVDEGTFHADMLLRRADGSTATLSVRPSDAIALAVRTGCPVWATEAVLATAGVREQAAGDDVSAWGAGVMDEFHEFIENISPEDFDS